MRRALAFPVALVLAGALTPLGPATAQEATGLHIPSVDVSGYPEVVVTTTVSADLDSPDRSAELRLTEDGEAQEAAVNQASSGDLEVVLLIDTTGSMGGAPIAAAREAASSFIQRLPADSRLAVVGYDVDVTVVSDFDASRDEHLAGVDSLRPDGSTAMYDAIITTLDHVFAEPADGVRQAIIVLTDGEDNASSADLDDAAERLARSEVTLQGVEYLTAFSDEAGLRSLVEASGGRVFAADDPEALVRTYEDLAADLINSYTLRYESTGTGQVELTVSLDQGDGSPSATRTIVLPAPVEASDEPADSLVAPSTGEPPAIEAPVPSSRIGLFIGVGAWFAALTLLLLALFAPRERQAQLSGTAALLRRNRSGSHEVAERVTLVADGVLQRRGYHKGLNAALERAGIDLRPAEFVVVVLGAAAGASAIGVVLNGFFVGLLMAVVTVVVARLFVSFRAGRRQSVFAEQLADTLQLLSGSLRAGYSLMQAIDAVAREADAPTADEFGRVVVETRLGRDIGDAFTAMADRMQTEDFVWVMQAIQIHREVGGDLAEVLDTVGNTIRERDQVRRQVKALSAEGRLSGYVLLALPFAIGFLIYLTNRPYLAELTQGGLLGWGLLGIGGLLMTVGTVWMRKLVKLEF